MRHLSAIAVAFAILIASNAASVRAQGTTQGQWTLTPSRQAGLLRLDLQTRHDATQAYDDSVSTDLAPSELGISDNDSGSGKHVTLHFSREAGSFALDGWLEHSTGGGTFTFTPSASYVDAMRARGYGDISPDKQLVAALLDLNGAYIDSLAREGYAHLPYDKLIAFRALGVDGSSIADLASVGYKGLDSDQLIELRALHIDSGFIKRVQAHGLASLSVNQLVRVKALDIVQ